MKLQETTIDIQKIGTFESIDFSIKFDAKMSELLSSALYSNKIASIVRELGCNANDSNILAGTSKPFDVALPTRFSPQFSIRDYGVGLSQEQIKTVYTVYGVSDKTNSNLLTGCLGLGSKTPLCYHTKSAVIDSYVNNIHYSYQLHLNEKGVPCLTKLIEEPSTEPTGVKITIPVMTYDIDTFRKECINVYQWFKQKPNVVPGIVYPNRNKVVGYDQTSTTSVLMGNVLYPVKSFDMPKDLRVIFDLNLVLEVDIGSVEPAISRESLQYTDLTKKTIIDALEKIRKEITSKDIYKDCKTIHQAKLTWLKSGLPSNFKELFLYNGQQLNLSFSNNVLYKYGTYHNRFEKSYYQKVEDIPIYTKDIWNAKQRIRNNNKECFLLMEYTPEILKELELEPDEVIPASSLPHIPTKRQKQVDLSAKKWEYRKWLSYRIKDTDNITYITGDLPERYTFKTTFDYAKQLDPTLEVYYLSNKVYEKIKDKSNFVAMEKKIESLIKNKQHILTIYDKVNAISNQGQIIKNILSNINHMPQHVQQELKDYIDLKPATDAASIYNIAKFFKLYTPQTHNVLSDFVAKYPILNHLDYYTPKEIIIKCLECFKV